MGTEMATEMSTEMRTEMFPGNDLVPVKGGEHEIWNFRGTVNAG